MKRVVDLYKISNSDGPRERFMFVFDNGSVFDMILSLYPLDPADFTNDSVKCATEYFKIIENIPLKITARELLSPSGREWWALSVLISLYYDIACEDFQYTLYLFRYFVDMLVQGKVYEKDS